MEGDDPNLPRVLVVEDNLLVAEDLSECLRDWGYAVIGPAARVAQAVDLACEAAIDAAVLDVNLDGEPVFPAARALRQRDVPFVFVTGYMDIFPPEFEAAPKLFKPVDCTMLKPLLAEQVGRAAAPARRAFVR